MRVATAAVGATTVATLQAPAAAALLDAMSAIAEQQLPTGEIAAFAPGTDGRLAYRRSLAASVAVHDALACLDPTSTWQETGGVRSSLAPEATTRLCLAAARVRRRSRAFLAWQELPGHLWREGGRHGVGAADPALSAAAATALLDDPARAADRWPRSARAIRRAADAGTSGGRPSSASGGAGETGAGAPVAAFLALAGEDVEELATGILERVERAAATIPLDLAATVARCWARAHLPGRERLAAALAPELRARLDDTTPADDAADATAAAQALLALLDLGAPTGEIAPADLATTARKLFAELPLAPAWGRPTTGELHCPAVAQALVLAAAARTIHLLAEEGAPCLPATS